MVQSQLHACAKTSVYICTLSRWFSHVVHSTQVFISICKKQQQTTDFCTLKSNPSNIVLTKDKATHKSLALVFANPSNSH